MSAVEHSFACVPCLVAFRTRQEQKEHLLSDWHCYNLKRRLADLEPVTTDEYARKIHLIELQGAKSAIPSSTRQCSRKKIEGRRSRQKHVEATTLLGHRSALLDASAVIRPSPATSDEAGSGDEMDDDATTQYDIRFSLFDTHVADSFNENLEYMKKYNSLFLHDREYLKDLEGFITYLGRKVYEGHQCLYCNRPFRSVQAVRRHMIDRGHRLIGTHLDEHQEEYEPYFDYSESYKELHLPEHVIAKLPALMMAPVAEEPLGDGAEEEEWEVVEEYYEDDAEEEGMILSGRPIAAGTGADERTWQEKLEAIGFRQAHLNEEGNLVLPNDNEIISRKNLRPGFKLAMVRPRPRRLHVPAIAETAHNTAESRQVAQDSAKQIRAKQQSEMRLGVKSNRLYRYIARKNKIFI